MKETNANFGETEEWVWVSKFAPRRKKKKKKIIPSIFLFRFASLRFAFAHCHRQITPSIHPLPSQTPAQRNEPSPNCSVSEEGFEMNPMRPSVSVHP